jgi:hypothetical protein
VSHGLSIWGTQKLPRSKLSSPLGFELGRISD